MKYAEWLDLRAYIGDVEALCGIMPVTLTDGLSDGTRAFLVRNGRGLNLTVLSDRGLDIPFCTYHGKNVGFYSRNGIAHPAFFQEDASRGFLRRFYGGLLTTCGMLQAGAACVDEGEPFGLHGRYSNTPAEQVCAESLWVDDELVLRIAGRVRETCSFAENLHTRRELLIHTERDLIEVTDTVTNLGFRDEVVMPDYHINFGYPLLDAGTRLYVSASKVEPCDDVARAELDSWNVMEPPTAGRPEACFYHTGESDPKNAWAMVHNENLGIAAILRYDAQVLPILCEWKCMMAGDYALGVEPTAAGVAGRASVRAAGNLPMLAPGEQRVFSVSIELTRDAAEIDKRR